MRYDEDESFTGLDRPGRRGGAAGARVEGDDGAARGGRARIAGGRFQSHQLQPQRGGRVVSV